MALAKSRARSSIYLGVTVLLFCTVAVVCGAISTAKLSTGFGATIGLWALYFFVPGILFMMAGFTKHRGTLKMAATTNIIGSIVAIFGLIIGSAYWARLNVCSRGMDAVPSNRKDLISSCVCGSPSETFRVIIDDDPNCSEILVPRKVTAVATMMHLVLGMVSFVCIYYFGCKPAREPTLVVAATVPFRPNTVSIVFTNHGASYDQPAQPSYPSVEQRQSEITAAHSQQRSRQNHFELAPTVHSNQLAQQQQQQQQQPEQQQQPPPAYCEHVFQQHYTTRIVAPVISQQVVQDYQGIAPPAYSEHVVQHESSTEIVAPDRRQQVAQQHYPGIAPPVYSERCRTTITEQRTSHVSYNITTYL